MSKATFAVYLASPDSSDLDFEWLGDSESKEAAEKAAYEAYGSCIEMMGQGHESPIYKRFKGIETVFIKSIDNSSEEYIGYERWGFGPYMDGYVSKQADRNFYISDLKNIDYIVKCVISMDSSIEKLDATDEIKIVLIQNEGINFRSNSIRATSYNDLDPWAYSPIDLEEETIFALLTLGMVLPFGEFYTSSSRGVSVKPPKAASLRAAERSLGPSKTQEAIQFFEVSGALRAAERLRTRGVRRNVADGPLNR